MIHIWRPFWGLGGRVRQKWDVVRDTGRRRLASVLDVQYLIFLLKEIGFASWPDIMLCQTLIYYCQEIFLLTLTVRQWSHPLIIPLHCLQAKSNNRARGQFECEVTWFCFCFDFVCSIAPCGCCSIVCLRFQVVRIKQIDCKMSTKNVNHKQKTFRDIFLDDCTHNSIRQPKSREWGFS